MCFVKSEVFILDSLKNKIKNKCIYEFEKIKESFIFLFNEYLVRNSCKKPIVETMDETIEKVKNGASISRYGDGEIDIIVGRSQGFQKQDKELGKRLKYVLKQNGKYENFLVGIPYIFENLNIFTDKAIYHWQVRLNRERYKWYRLLNRKEPYSNSQITRFYFDWRDKSNCKKWADELKSIWKNRSIIIVEGSKSRVGVGNDLFINSKSIERIICPSESAYDIYEKILRTVSAQDKSKLILIALGPTASVLAYDLYLEGFQVIDIGHIDIEYEWMLKNAQEKIAIEGKYVNEVESGRKVNDIYDKEYESQIIYELDL